MMTERTVWEGLVVGTYPAENGRTLVKVECGGCGKRNAFYKWAWAGNGNGRCRNCGDWIGYMGGQRREE